MSRDSLFWRVAMVEQQLRARYIRDEAVLTAFRRVPRHRFAPHVSVLEAYADHPIHIEANQTISQPYIVAYMLQLLGVRPSDVVLEIGTGSGYQTALLALLAKKVYSVELLSELSASARARLNGLGIENIELHVGDGTLGWPEAAPFDTIIVSAAAPAPPPPLVEQLADGGRLVIPLGDRVRQELTLLEKHHGEISQSQRGGCVFVPLIGQHGWKS